MILSHRISENTDQGQEYWSILTGEVRREECRERAVRDKNSGTLKNIQYHDLLLYHRISFDLMTHLAYLLSEIISFQSNIFSVSVESRTQSV